MKRESFFGESGGAFLDLVKASIMIGLVIVYGIPMMERAWENRSMLLDFIWKVYGL
jgi:uncharacterized protein (UPF0303 family)